MAAAVTLPDAPATASAPARNPALSERERRIVRALAAAIIPPGSVFEPGGEGTLRRFERWLDGSNAFQMRLMKSILWTAELSSIPATGRVLSALAPERATRFFEDWSRSRLHVRRLLLRAVSSPIKVAHFDDRRAFEAVGCKSFHDHKLPVSEPARWTQQVMDGRAVDEDLDLECEVVVVGTGAGGAACAHELASRGRAVLMLEEGDFHRRDAFTGRTQPMVKKLYRDQGMTIAIGNVGIPVFAGRAVGGTTVVNSGTCYRAPERIFRRWREEDGLAAFSRKTMDPYYERVEAMLRVERARFELTGGVGRVVARGAEKMGLRHRPVLRNAPDCDGQGVCCFGCPTGAKRSTDVSYVPAALERGAQLVTAAHVDGIDVVGGRARGVTARLASGRRLRVRAEAVVVAGGALMTPLVLKEAGVCGSSPALGKNLSIHPATKTLALFDEAIDMSNGIPQGYSIDELEHEGIMFEGGSMPLEVLAVSVPWVGARFVDLMARYRTLALFGFMIEDTSRGEVRPGPRGSPLIVYNMNRRDTARMHRAMAVMCEVFLAAGAKRVYPMVPGMEELATLDEVRQLRAMKLSPSAFDVTAYHPLGTCRMGTDPKTSVVGPDFETHEVERLFVADGSVVPSALGVNPQMTIMSMALRAGEIIDAAARRLRRRASPRHRRDLLERLALRVHAKRRRNNPAHGHQDGADQVRVEDARALAGLDERAEERRRGQTPRARPHAVEERDRHAAQLDGKELAHREVGRARCRGRDEESDGPQGGLRLRRQPAFLQAPAGDRDEDRGEKVRRGDHGPPSDRVEEPPEGDRPEQVADGERDEIEPDSLGRDAVEADEDQGVGEEHAIVGEGLPDHECQAQNGPPRVSAHELPDDRTEADGPLHHERVGQTRRGEGAPRILDVPLDLAGDFLGLLLAAVKEEPSRALGKVISKEEHTEGEGPAEQEGRPPREPGRQDAWIGDDQREHRPQRGAQPVRAVDGEVGVAAVAGRQELVDGGVDRRSLAADTRAREGAEEGERREAPGERRHDRRDGVERQRDEEEPLAPEHVREAAEDERAGDCAEEVGRGGQADLGVGEAQGVVLGEQRSNRADERDLEAVEHPCHAERDDDAKMPAGPRETIEPGGDVAPEVRAGGEPGGHPAPLESDCRAGARQLDRPLAGASAGAVAAAREDLARVEQPSGIEGALHVRWSAMSASLCSSGRYSAFERRCRARRSACRRDRSVARISIAIARSTAGRSASSFQRKFTWRLPSPAWP